MAVWIRWFIVVLCVVLSTSRVVGVCCDDNDAIAQVKRPSSSSKSIHVLRKYQMFRHYVDSGVVRMCTMHTDDNIADPLTKPMPRPKHDSHTRAKGLKSIREFF